MVFCGVRGGGESGSKEEYGAKDQAKTCSVRCIHEVSGGTTFVPSANWGRWCVAGRWGGR